MPRLSAHTTSTAAETVNQRLDWPTKSIFVAPLYSVLRALMQLTSPGEAPIAAALMLNRPLSPSLLRARMPTALRVK